MNDATIHVRPSTDADLAAIHAIYAHHVTHGFGSFEEVPPGLDEMAARRLAVLERGMPHLVAEAGGRVLGYAYAGPYRPRPAYRSEEHTSELQSLLRISYAVFCLTKKIHTYSQQ